MAETAPYDPLGAAGTWHRYRAKLVVYALLGLFALYYLLPLVVVILNSFRDLSDISRNGLINLPHSFSLDYWSLAWDKFCVGGTCLGIEPSSIRLPWWSRRHLHPGLQRRLRRPRRLPRLNLLS